MKLGVRGKLAALLFTVVSLAAVATAFLSRAIGSALGAAVLVAATGALLAIWAAAAAVRPLQKVLRALNGVVASYRDGDFNSSLVVGRDDELGQLLAIHNELGKALREERAYLVQRELLLETVMQNSPVALVLVDAYERVAYENQAARHLLNAGRSLLGQDFTIVLQKTAALRHAALAGEDTLFSAEIDGLEDTFHLSQRSFLLQGRSHRLYLLKRLTRELSRQEVAIWKNLIRVVSHELNNSLAPIVSLAHSGAKLARRGDVSELDQLFDTIRERATHLHEFIAGYAAFAKLPAPQPEAVDWPALTGRLIRQQGCRVAGGLPPEPGWFDRSQLEQALINLLKNAHESGGPASEVELAVTHSGGEQRIEVRDRGRGMTVTVLAQALLPFYSTKRSGTGLGLALAREIAEAHGGRIHLANRDGGGLCVTLTLPLPALPSVRRISC